MLVKRVEIGDRRGLADSIDFQAPAIGNDLLRLQVKRRLNR
jgi:hypothetical protein